MRPSRMKAAARDAIASLAFVAAIAMISHPERAAAQASAQDPDWPCVQRLVPKLAPGMIWSGPPIESIAPGEDDAAIERLAGELAARRVPVERARELVAAFAEKLAPEERNEALTRLFARTLTAINEERASLINGIRRYARGQRRLAEKITEQNERLGEIAPENIAERDTLMMERDWDIRIFEDRQDALGYLCDQPVLLDQRAFELARTIAGHLEEG